MRVQLFKISSGQFNMLSDVTRIEALQKDGALIRFKGGSSQIININEYMIKILEDKESEEIC